MVSGNDTTFEGWYPCLQPMAWYVVLVFIRGPCPVAPLNSTGVGPCVPVAHVTVPVAVEYAMTAGSLTTMLLLVTVPMLGASPACPVGQGMFDVPVVGGTGTPLSTIAGSATTSW